MKQVLAIILGGGKGSRLYPLTKLRAKPAVPIAGRYRLIDIPISNCINSAINKIYVLTQFNSASLNRHISQTYQFPGFMDGFVEVLAAQQTPEHSDWFGGTADAVRQYLWRLESWSNVEEFIILSGDHLYRMDYEAFIQQHRAAGAAVSVAVVPVGRESAARVGLVKTNPHGQIVDFAEKPQGEVLDQFGGDLTLFGLPTERARVKPFMASMGIYIFNKAVLFELFHRYPEAMDFGQDILPRVVQSDRVQAYPFKGYWEDIGTIKSFYCANLALTQQPQPVFNLYDQDAPFYTRSHVLPPSTILNCRITESIVAEGCTLNDCRVNHSIVGARSRIGSGCVVEHSLIMGAEDDPWSEQRSSLRGAQGLAPGIGRDCLISHAIIDKNVHIGENTKIFNKDRVEEADREELGFCIRSGIVVVLKNAQIPAGTVI